MIVAGLSGGGPCHVIAAGTSDFFHPWKKSTRKKSAVAILQGSLARTRGGPRFAAVRNIIAASATTQRHDFLARYNFYAMAGHEIGTQQR